MRSRKAPVRRKRRMGWREALRRESDRAEGEMIRGKLALPMNKRVGFLRVRHPGGGSHV